MPDQTGYERLPLLTEQELNPDQKRLFCRISEDLLPWTRASGFQGEGADNTLLGPFNAILYEPEMGAAHLNSVVAERGATVLDATVREVVILTVGAACEAAYELYAHRAVAAKAGLKPEDIEALATGAEPQGLSPLEQLAHRFVDALVRKHRVPDDLYAEALRAFGHRGLVDMVHLTGLYLTTSAILNAFAVPVP